MIGYVQSNGGGNMFGRIKERLRKGKKLAKEQPKTLSYEELGQRVLFSADIMPGLDTLGFEERVVVEDVVGGVQLAQEAFPSMVEQAAEEERRELVIVNENVSDYQQLIADLQGGDNKRVIEVVVLEADRDGIDQISEILADRSDLAAVHFITHGAGGQINLGNSWLNSNSLQQNSQAVGGWGSALTEKGDFLFYGCNIATDIPGRTLLNDIARLTGADVTASDDLTGQAQFGGDWVFEYDRGSIETALAISGDAQQNWNGVLATFTVNTTLDTVDTSPGDGVAADAAGNTSLRAAIMEANAVGGANEIILNAGTYTLSLGPAGEDNAARGDLDVTGELAITGAGADVTIIDGNLLDSVFHLKGDAADLTLTDLTIKGGRSNGHGGGIHVGHNMARLTATRIIVSGNLADKGAGIFNHGTMTLTDVVISSNGDAATREGGGIYNERVAILNGVTIGGNQADDGGGIINDNKAGSISLTNVTISGNTATNKGGGLYTQKPATIVNSTITLNSAAAGGGISHNGGTIDLKNTIVAGNMAALNPDVEGALNSQGNNLIGDKGTASGFSNGVNDDQVGTAGSPIDPLLGALQDNGGYTQTHALLAGSPAIDAGDNSVGLADDQRRYSRPLDGNSDETATIDIGAYEYTPLIVSYYLDGVGDGSDIPTASLKPSAPADITLDNFDPGRDSLAGLILAKSDIGLSEADPTKYQQWITEPGAIKLNGPANLSLWSAMKDFDVTKAGSITAYLVDSDAAGNDLTEITNTTVTRDDWDVANAGTWIEDTFDFGTVDYTLNAGRYLGVKITVNNGLAADAMWLAYDVTSSPSSLTVTCVPNTEPSGGVKIDNMNPAQGNVLTVSNSLADADGLSGPIRYQWQRDGVNINGASDYSYTTVQADVGTIITVVASYTDDLGFDESVSSAGTAAVTNVNDAPAIAGTAAGQTVDDNAFVSPFSLVTISDADFGEMVTVVVTLSDGDDNGSFTATSLTASGFTRTDIGEYSLAAATPADAQSAIRLLVFDPTENQAAAGSTVTTAFTIAVNDGDVTTTDNTTTVIATSINDAPVLSNNKLSISEGATVIFDSSMLSATDADNPDPGLTFSVSTVNGGQFERVSTGLALTAFTQADIAAADVRFVHDGSETAPSYDVSVTDGSATVGPIAAAINFTNVNDPGSLTIDNTTPAQGNTLTAGVMDPDGVGGTIAYQWYRDGAAIGDATAAVYTTTQADVGKVVTVAAHYTDDRGTVENLISASTTAVINVNDAPVLGNNSLTISEGATVTIDSSMLAATDVDHPDPLLTFNVSGVTAGHFAFSSDTATPITSFDQSDITAGNVVFVHDGSQTQPGYSISVTDGADSTAAITANITFNNLIDTLPPDIDYLTLSESNTDSPENSQVPPTDEVTPAPPATAPESVVNAAQLAVSSDAVTSISGLDHSDIPAGTVVFVQDNPGAQPAAITDIRRVELGRDNDMSSISRTFFSYQRLKLLLEAHDFGELKTAMGNMRLTTLSSADYDLVRSSLDAIKAEIGKEILYGRTVVGSAIATSIGLSVGYVVWLLKGGSLLASVLSSMPAWQLADPLAILVGKNGDDDDDDESLETIIDEGSKRDDDQEPNASKLNNLKKKSVKQ